MKRYVRKSPRSAISPINVSEIASLTVVVAAGFAFANFILSHAWRGERAGLVYSNILVGLFLSLLTAFVLTYTLKPEKLRYRVAKFEDFMNGLRELPRNILIVLTAITLLGTAYALAHFQVLLGYALFLSLLPISLISLGNMTKPARFAAWYLVLSGLWTFGLAFHGNVV